jgi:chemotaxis signal transduction protein
VLDIPESEIQDSPSIEAKYKLEFIQGMFQRDEEFVMLLNLGEVFSIEDVNLFHQTGNANGE